MIELSHWSMRRHSAPFRYHTFCARPAICAAPAIRSRCRCSGLVHVKFYAFKVLRRNKVAKTTIYLWSIWSERSNKIRKIFGERRESKRIPPRNVICLQNEYGFPKRSLKIHQSKCIYFQSCNKKSEFLCSWFSWLDLVFVMNGAPRRMRFNISAVKSEKRIFWLRCLEMRFVLQIIDERNEWDDSFGTVLIDVDLIAFGRWERKTVMDGNGNVFGLNFYCHFPYFLTI